MLKILRPGRASKSTPVGAQLARIAAAILVLTATPVWAATYYVDRANGSDQNSGTSMAEALQSVSGANRLSLQPGDEILFRAGQSYDGVLDLDTNGSSNAPISVGAWGSGAAPILFGLSLSADWLVVEDLVIDHQKDASDAIRLRDARQCTLRNLEIRNGTRDAIDANGADGLLVESVHIHHFLNGTFGSLDDSHGVALTDTDGATIRDANIHHVSGDSVQVDPNRVPGAISNNIRIEDATLWTGPLDADFNAGWQRGDNPGENALDTKVLKSGFENEPRMVITLVNVTAYGWSAIAQLNNRAAFNLKEKIAANLDRITVYDSEIAFRVRGSLGNANTTIANAVIYDVDVAIRAETDLAELDVYNSTFGNGIGTILNTVNGAGGVNTWDWRNNAFIGSQPNAATAPSNQIATNADFVDAAGRNYALADGSSLAGQGEPVASVTVDRTGAPRTSPYDIGAYASGQAVKRPNPPTLIAN